MSATDPRTADLLWPAFNGPDDLAAVEAVPFDERPLPASTYRMVTEAARKRPTSTALVLLPSGERWKDGEGWSFARLADRVHRIANAFFTHGIRRRDAVALMCANTGDTLAATLAAQAAGIAAPINPALSEDKAERLLTLSGATVLVASGPELDEGTWARARSLARDTGVETLLAVRPDGARGPAPELMPLPGTIVAHLDDIAADMPGDRPLFREPAAGDFAAYFHTGGTTGAPRIAVHTHANQTAMAWSLMLGADLPENAVLLAGLPLFHVNALLVTCLSPLMRGQTVVWAGPQGYRDPHLYGDFWKIVEHHRVNAMSAVPTVYGVLNAFPVDADISSLLLPVVGAAPLPESVRTGFRELTGLELCEGYGLTEATCASAREWPGGHRPGSVGQRLPYQRIKAVHIDPETGRWRDLPAGTPGNLVISGPTVFAGYLVPGPDGRPVPDASGRVVDGWLDTGDIGHVDGEGFVHLVGRAKDIIIRGGHNIDPAVIEEALLTHPDVTGASAVGRPDPHAGEVPVAYVTLAPGASADPRALREWAARNVGEGAAAPKDVHIIDAIPVTEVGKQFKPALREDAARRAALAELEALDPPVRIRGVTASHVNGRLTVTVDAPADELPRLHGALADHPFDRRLVDGV